jgi:hypothetical protein
MKNKYYILPVVILAISGGAVFYSRMGFDSLKNIETFNVVSQPVSIDPDYTGIILPPNIAPLNFSIKETGKEFFVRIYADKGGEIKIVSKKSKIIIPLEKWRPLLNANCGGKLFFDIYVKNEQNNWNKYPAITNSIAEEQIDPTIAYRLIKPIFNRWHSVGIYQRNLTNYDESVIVHGESFEHGCVNCHTFLNNSPDKMLFGIRSEKYGAATIFKNGKAVNRIGTKFTYTAWHPSGKLAVYSTNKINEFFHASGMEVRGVVDLDSALLYYRVDTKTVGTNPAIADKARLETYPAWSPDGKYLYFCSAPITWTDNGKIPPDGYENIKYDLMRIRYDVDNDRWGQLETVLPAEKTGLSILLPRISPDGRFLLFCMCKYGCFPIYSQDSDLYMMDLQTGQYNKLDINSEYSESWHSWSSNSRWIAFSSKRQGGMFTRTYFSYVDKSGKAHKPFVLPQEDPAFYGSFLKTYSVPELITGPVAVSSRELAGAVRSSNEIKVSLPITGATTKQSKPVQEYPPRE